MFQTVEEDSSTSQWEEDTGDGEAGTTVPREGVSSRIGHTDAKPE
jgi:hypothetical protein